MDKWGQLSTMKMLVQTSLLGRRRLALPWLDKSTERTLPNISTLQYTGQMAVSMPNVPVFPVHIQLTQQLMTRGRNWSQYQELVLVQGYPGFPPNEEYHTVVSGTSQIGEI